MPEGREPPPTDEGWYALHDFRTVDWDAWRAAPDRARDRALAEADDHLTDAVAVADADEGVTALYSILGHKADLLVLHLRPSTGHLDSLQRQFEGTAFAEYTDRASSYVSVTEASGYSERARSYFEGDLDPESGLARYIRSRLYPAVPERTHVCFYPMDKRREPDQNWYDLPFAERADHMDAHGEIGRSYGDRVSQMITGSIGLDDWEWGVTLWANDLTALKDLLYEMRFDPSTAQFADFGPFFVGRRFPPSDLDALLAGEVVPTAEEGTESAAGAAGTTAEHRDENGHSSGPASATDAGSNSTAPSAHDDGPADGHPSSADGAGRPDVSGTVEEVDDVDRRLTIMGLREGDDWTAGEYVVLAYSDADATDLAAAVEDLAKDFDHYDRHVDTVVRAQEGRAAAVTLWTAKEAAETAAGFMGDLPGVTEIVGGHLGDVADSADSSETESAHAPASDGTAEDDAVDIREALAERDIYAGRPHGEDVYALVLYSTADKEPLFEETVALRKEFDRYDTHVKTAVYENPETATAAVVSLWDSERGADRAGDHLAELPGIVGKPQERDGFGTMGMFYTVEPEHRADFVEKFDEVTGVLAGTDGHRETGLLVNREDENDMFIASRWDSKEDAMGFFRSDAFSETVDWGRDVLADRPRHVFLA